MEREYKASRGAPFSEKKAQIYGRCIEEIEEKRGGTVKPVDVVNAARDSDSPLHDYFEWDDELAGAKYRIYQARQLLNHLTVVVKTNGGERVQKAYLNVSLITEDSVEPIYVTVERALTDKEFRKQTLAKAIAEAKYWQQKYKEYTELSEIFAAIERAKEAIEIEEYVKKHQKEEWDTRIGTFKE